MAQMNPFSLRLVMADYYLSRPISELDVTFSEFRGSEIKQLPVVRVFGATPDGRKACLHVHGVFPYLYIPCEDPNPEPKTAYQIANSIDKALNISLKQANSTNQHVYKVHLVRGIPFYGFHSKVHQFYKIFFYNPSFIKRASDLLQSGAILGSSYQPHEAHINFTMQFFLDFNLYGMSFINLDYVKFRRKGLPILHTNEIKEDMYLPESVEFTSCCELEADCLAQHILNRKDVLGGNLGTNPGLEALWEDEKQRLVNTDMSNSLVPTPSQARENVPPTASHIHNQQLLLTKLTLNSEMQNNPLNANQTQSDIQFTPEALSKAVYPAETPEESDILNATSVSLHHPTSVLRTWDVCSDTTVDESLVLHLSQNMHLSRVNLDSDDMDFMVMLRDMEDKIEEDSVLGTQLNIHREEDLEEEKQPNFDELFTEESVENVEEPSQSALWNDTYWDNVQNISQLDGAWDTEDQSKKSTVKKKGKLKIGLSKPRKYIAGGIKQDVDCQSPDGKSISKKIEEFKIELSSPISPKKSPKRPLNLNPLTGFFKTSPTIGHKFSLTAFKSIENEKKGDVLESVPTTPAGPGPGPGTLTSSGYDRLNSYFPVAGTSTAYQNDTSDISIPQSSSSDENDLGVISFYDTTLHQDSSFINKRFTDFTHNTPLAACGEHSPAPTTKPSSRNDSVNLHYDVSSSGAEESLDRTKKRMVLVAEQPPPLYSDVVGTMEEHSIPGCTHRQPFYSKAQDVGSHIEVGQIILKIKSKTLADLKPFMSHITDSSTLETWRENVFLMKNITQNHLSINDLTAVLASNTRYILTPVVQPPSPREVTDWLLSSDDECLNIKNALPVPSKDNSIVYLPPSPGQDTSNSQVETLSISPASAEDSTPPESAPAVSKSTTKKRKSLSQPARKLRPRALRLSLAAPPPAPQLEVICGSSPDSNDYEIPCGQKSLNVLKASEHIEDELDKFKMSDKALDMTAEAMEGVTGNSTLGFKFSGENFQDAATLHEHEYLTVLVLEVLTSTRGEMYPDPALDPVLALFYSLLHDGPPHHTRAQQETGVIISRDDGTTSYLEGINKNTKITFVQNEECIFEELLSLMGKWDPDILCGYEIEMLSWGYLFQRGFILDMNLPSKISRVPLEVKPDWKKFSPEISKEIKLVGRITLDVWRLLRHEVSLTSYSFESVMYHVMHERVPKFSFRTLHFWWSHPSGLLRCEAVDYLLTRVIGVGHILQQLDLVGRTSELARLFGIQWYEVLSRGSQFRVESMMFRMTRPRNYVLVSPSVQQRAAMRAPECLPLILEPESRFYSDPVIVLDFQSLYPSMMIAYNYCFSTCVGSIRNMGRDTPYEFGCTQLRVPPGLLERLARAGQLNWSPVGAGFVRPAVRRGVLPLLLTDILRTRLMVKKAMKKHKHNKTLQKILHSRQLGLKLIANVTYGYAAANFSGRMPCVEVADSVVAKGRETLTRAIQLVHSTPRWGARVVYGDTDSLFVLVAGRSRSEAFNIGAEIAEAVTNDNPSPVKLKLEKVFHPCILQTKKRYVGYMYESKDQTTPEYCAKGIETVRRDGCPIASKMLEKTLRILFESGDVSKVKAYVCGEFQKIMEGNCNIRDFVFAKEFRGLNNYKPGASLPALEIARFAEIPRKQVQLYPILEFSSEGKKSTIAQYFATVSCAGCAEPAGGGLCGTCLRSPQKTMLTLQTKMSRWQRKLDQTNKICQSCCGSAAPPDCVSADCPVLFRRASARQDALQIPFVNKMAQKLIDF